MLHITTQFLSAKTKHNGLGHLGGLEKSEGGRRRQRLKPPPVRLDPGCLIANSLQAQLGPNFSSSPSPFAPSFNGLPSTTPISSTSSIFDCPQKSSPSSSASSTNPLMLVVRSSTPIAELEDTSPSYMCPELEDTSNHAVQSHSSRKISSFTLKSTNLTARSIVSVVDQQLSDYEAEIHFLRRSLAEAEKSLRTLSKSFCEVKETLNDSKHAITAAQATISNRDYEIKIKNLIIADLEKDVKHCQEHHPPPPLPSKLQGTDRAVSRFNIDANRSSKLPDSKETATVLSPSLIGRQFAATPDAKSQCSPTTSLPKTPRSNLRAGSSNTSSPRMEGSPLPQSHNVNLNPRSGACKSVTTEALAAAVSFAASPSKLGIQSTNCQISEVSSSRIASLERPLITRVKQGADSPASKPRPHDHRAIQFSVSSPNLRAAQNPSHRSSAIDPSPAPPITCDGLGISEGLLIESSEHRLRKIRGNLGDIFRRKDGGLTPGI